MRRAQKGDTVKVHYTGSIEDGKVFDTSRQRGPREFTLGAGRILGAFEEAVEGMAAGEAKTVRVPYREAFGERNEDLVVRVERSRFPSGLRPEVGLPMNIRHRDGSMLDVFVTEVTEETVTLDGNHPLAGKDLIFEIELLEIAGEAAH
jgi:peptidylprolyl isomerase